MPINGYTTFPPSFLPSVSCFLLPIGIKWVPADVHFPSHAPPQILHVRVGQPVELRVTRRLNEDYVPAPQRPLGVFEGQGNRLGAAIPETTAALASSSLAGALG